VPEGDTIHRAANTLNIALAGRGVTRFETALAQLAGVSVEGRTVERVIAVGKHLIIEFSGDLHLHTHMRMHGEWHIYRPGERWQRRRDAMRIVIETDAWVAVAFNVPVAEFRKQDLHRILGPDLVGETFDADEAMRRIREREDSEIANALLNQRVVAGIGNEYKSEVLFASGVNPFALVRDLSDDEIATILRNARKLMRASVRPQYVYGRGGKPCRKCGTPIAYAKQGPDVRGTYWCPRCQGER